MKRTPTSVSKELNFPKKKIDSLLSGDFNHKDLFKFLNLMTGFYPIDISDLIITKKDTINGLLFFKSRESKKVPEFSVEEEKINSFQLTMNTEIQLNQTYHIFIQNGLKLKDLLKTIMLKIQT